MKIGKFVSLLACLLCCGCAEVSKKRVAPSPQFEDCNTLFCNKDFDEICRRIARLDFTTIAPGKGINVSRERLIQLLVAKYRFNISQDAIINRGAYNCADTEENRIKNIEIAIQSPHKILWAICGGYGTNFIIPDLNKKSPPRNKKTLVGFSDITSLLLFASQKWGWRAIHAPVMIHLVGDKFSREKFDTLLDILEGRVDRYVIDGVHPLNESARRSRCVRGKLTGGNLTLVESSIGTCWEVQARGKILFVEDIHSKPHWIYRSMHHLRESGRLNGVSAIVFGEFTNSGSSEEIHKFLHKFARETSAPVYVTNQFGHGDRNKPLIYNAEASIQDNKITVDAKFTPHTERAAAP